MTDQKRNRDEAEFHSKLVKWLGYHKHLFTKSYLFETKVIRRKETSFDVKELTAKEERLLLQAKYKSVIQTHSDYGGMGTNCDGSCISGSGLIFIQKFTVPENKIFYCIDIDHFIKKRDSMTRKSMTVEHFKEIGIEYELKKLN